MFLFIGIEIKLDFSIFQMQFSLKDMYVYVLLSYNEDFLDESIEAFPNSSSLKDKLNFPGMYTISSILVSVASALVKA